MMTRAPCLLALAAALLAGCASTPCSNPILSHSRHIDISSGTDIPGVVLGVVVNMCVETERANWGAGKQEGRPHCWVKVKVARTTGDLGSWFRDSRWFGNDCSGVPFNPGDLVWVPLGAGVITHRRYDFDAMAAHEAGHE